MPGKLHNSCVRVLIYAKYKEGFRVATQTKTGNSVCEEGNLSFCLPKTATRMLIFFLLWNRWRRLGFRAIWNGMDIIVFGNTHLNNARFIGDSNLPLSVSKTCLAACRPDDYRSLGGNYAEQAIWSFLVFTLKERCNLRAHIPTLNGAKRCSNCVNFSHSKRHD